jgi:hypothetical protein
VRNLRGPNAYGYERKYSIAFKVKEEIRKMLCHSPCKIANSTPTLMCIICEVNSINILRNDTKYIAEFPFHMLTIVYSKGKNLSIEETTYGSCLGSELQTNY